MKTGGAVSTTVTSNVALVVSPVASRAVAVTVLLAVRRLERGAV